MSDTRLAPEQLQQVQEFRARLKAEVQVVLSGQEQLLERLWMALLADGHVLLEGVPGLGKSLAVSAFARALGLEFRRIQFTPDLLPADVTGTQVFRPEHGDFAVKHGPVFAQIVLADEINRAPPKVQSALLEAMQERQVSIGEQTEPLPRPFLVLATQNPIEQEGTYPLPEAELDRFLMKVPLHYPSAEEEGEILRRHGPSAAVAAPAVVGSVEQIEAARAVLDQVHVDDKIIHYILQVVRATRAPQTCGRDDLEGVIRYGASPRASLALHRLARAAALSEGRGFVTPRDVKQLAADVLRHRLVLSYEAEAQGYDAERVLEELLNSVEVP